MKKLAFCFLIIDIINLEELWNIFFKNVNKNKYNIYIHFKADKKLKYFEKYKLNNCVHTQYADISLVKAQNLLLDEALADPETTHCIFISNSCIPLKNFTHIYNSLNRDYSYFNMNPNIECFPRFNSVLNFVKKKYIRKSHQWCILNRKHASLMLGEKSYLKWFRHCYAPDESAYITNIFNNRLEREIITTYNSTTSATTFVNWDERIFVDRGGNLGGRWGPKYYDSITIEELTTLLNSRSLFGRKFKRAAVISLVNKTYLDSITSS